MRYLFLFTLLFAGCSQAITLNEFDAHRFEGFVACVVNNSDTKPAPVPQPNVNVPGCTCGGTGKVKTGDGLHDTECPCGPNCTCNKVNVDPEVKTKAVQIYYFGSKNCGPCQKVKKDVFPRLEKRGWKIAEEGSGQDAHIVTFDLDKKPEMHEKYNIENIPVFIRMVDGKEVERREGYMSPREVAKFYEGK